MSAPSTHFYKIAIGFKKLKIMSNVAQGQLKLKTINMFFYLIGTLFIEKTTLNVATERLVTRSDWL
jgi:hypothetical protein